MRATARHRSAGNQGGYGGFYGGFDLSLLHTSVMRKQKTPCSSRTRSRCFTMLEEKSAEIRKKMTLKYQVEF